MLANLWLIPAFPLFSAALLMLSGGRLPRAAVSVLGVGSVALSALVVALVGLQFGELTEPYRLTLWTWLQADNLQPGISFYLDGLTLVMMGVITGVGLLIHLYSTEYMAGDPGYCRFFAYMNLFVAAMLVLVMADNLLLLYLGWEGVGLCSYLLIGFWYRDPENGWAARKAFVVTRVGDAAMALGLFLLFTQLGTLDIQAAMGAANEQWSVGGTLPMLAAALLLGGAVGKSAQLPLQTWLPDAMAGPTPVSALIHAATMVTAGVYLIARTHELFLLAPPVLIAVAVIGLLTALMAAFSALNQNDIKRILAYSTISQIGYMFLALGVGAWAMGVFHLVTHAFFKAVLFLAAGAVIHALHEEQDIFRMGGLRTRLPVAFWSMLIGCAALAALPFTAGFYSKDAILLAAWELPQYGPWLWAGALLGALLTAIYSFRLLFVVFFGPAQSEPEHRPGWRMAAPLWVLTALSLLGGLIALPLAPVFPPPADQPANQIVHWISIAVPLLGLALAYAMFLGRQLPVGRLVDSGGGRLLRRFWHSGWGMDWLYDRVIVRPFVMIAAALRREWVDAIYHAGVGLTRLLHSALSASQTGRLRWYATAMAVGLILLLTILVRVQ